MLLERRDRDDHPIAIVRLRNPLEHHILTRLKPMAAQQRLEAFSKEVRAAAPDTRLILPQHLEPIRLSAR